MKDVYPVGSVYISVGADLPTAFQNGMTWEKLTGGRCLWTAESNDQLGDENISATLPKPELDDPGHGHDLTLGSAYRSMNSGSTKGFQSGDDTAFKKDDISKNTTGITVKTSGPYNEDVSVRPPSIGVIMWKRTA